MRVPHSLAYARTLAHTHTYLNLRTTLAWCTEGKKSLFAGVWFCLKSQALFIAIKVPPTILPLLKSPQLYIILISTEPRKRREKEGLKFLQSFGKDQERKSPACPETVTKERSSRGLFPDQLSDCSSELSSAGSLDMSIQMAVAPRKPLQPHQDNYLNQLDVHVCLCSTLLEGIRKEQHKPTKNRNFIQTAS